MKKKIFCGFLLMLGLLAKNNADAYDIKERFYLFQDDVVSYTGGETLVITNEEGKRIKDLKEKINVSALLKAEIMAQVKSMKKEEII
ncbi:MAG: hypothetical protein PWQ78_773, partial [Petrotoga sp.]|nr:hypothetical protein [Petrotoga sp.]